MCSLKAVATSTTSSTIHCMRTPPSFLLLLQPFTNSECGRSGTTTPTCCSRVTHNNVRISCLVGCYPGVVNFQVAFRVSSTNFSVFSLLYTMFSYVSYLFCNQRQLVSTHSPNNNNGREYQIGSMEDSLRISPLRFPLHNIYSPVVTYFNSFFIKQIMRTLYYRNLD